MLYSAIFDLLFMISATVTAYNSQEQTNKNVMLTDWLTAIGTLASAFAAVGIAAYSFRITRRSEQRAGLAHVLQLLNDNAHRNARRRIYNLYQENTPSRRKRILETMGVKIENMETNYRESMEIVKADFDQIGTLVEGKAVLKNEFLKIFSYEVLKCWKVLHDDIIEVRKEDSNYMTQFEKLKSYAKEYTHIKVNDVQIRKDVIVGPKVANITRKVAGSKFMIDIEFDMTMDRNSISKVSLIARDNINDLDILGIIGWNESVTVASFETEIKNFNRSRKYDLEPIPKLSSYK